MCSCTTLAKKNSSKALYLFSLNNYVLICFYCMMQKIFYQQLFMKHNCSTIIGRLFYFLCEKSLTITPIKQVVLPHTVTTKLEVYNCTEAIVPQD